MSTNHDETLTRRALFEGAWQHGSEEAVVATPSPLAIPQVHTLTNPTVPTESTDHEFTEGLSTAERPNNESSDWRTQPAENWPTETLMAFLEEQKVPEEGLKFTLSVDMQCWTLFKTHMYMKCWLRTLE